MCSIFGILRLNNIPVTVSELYTGVQLLRHRGPDVQTQWLNADHTVGLAHARLSIIDLSENGNQPFFSTDQSVTTITNGEIYNFKALKQSLEKTGLQFRSQNDCELIPALYQTYGVQLFEYLDGMFATAIWDEAKRTLVLGRDPFGKKPLFYLYQPTQQLVFASELKALLPFLSQQDEASSPAYNSHISPSAFECYLTSGYTFGEQSIFNEIQTVPAGGYVTFEALLGNLTEKKYWYWTKPHLKTEVNSYTDLDWVAQFQQLFLKATEKRLLADVPLGAFLSGGVDSSSVVAAMHKLAPDVERHTFSINFSESSFDTDDYIDVLVKQCQLKHHRIAFDPADFVRYFEPVMQQNDGLLADVSLLPMFKLSDEASKVLKVVLTGDGADELLGGYETYRATRLAKNLGVLKQPTGILIHWASQLVLADSKRTKLNRSVMLQQLSRGLMQTSLSLTHARWRQIFMLSELQYVLNSNGQHLIGEATENISNFYDALWHQCDGSWLQKAQNQDIASWMEYSILPKVDQATMAYGLEARSPFLDKTLAEFCAAIPQKLRLKHPKWVLRQAMVDLLPKPICWQQKSGFNQPLSRWLIEEPRVRELAYYWLLSNQALAHGLFEKGAIEKLWRMHQYQDCHLKLWNVMVFNAWHYYWQQSERYTFLKSIVTPDKQCDLISN